MKKIFIFLITGICLAETWTHVTTETSSTKPFKSCRYAFNALITTNGTQGIANLTKPFSDDYYALNAVIVTNENGEYAMATRLADGGISLTNSLGNIYLQKSGDTAGALTVTNLTYLYDNHLHATNPIGQYAFSAGYGMATGKCSIAIGLYDLVPIGAALAYAHGRGAIAIGADGSGGSQAMKDYTLAILGGDATKYKAIAIGSSSLADGENSCALIGGKALGKDSFAVGSFGGTKAVGERSVSLGGEAYSKGSVGIADGIAEGKYSLAACDGWNRTNFYGHYTASGSEMRGGLAIALAGGRAWGYKSIAMSGMGRNMPEFEMIGYQKACVASNDYAVAIGAGSQATNLFSMALMGGITSISNSIALGVDTYCNNNQIKDLADGTAASDAVNLRQVQAMTNECLQVSNQVTVASSQGYLYSPDSTGTSCYFTTEIYPTVISNADGRIWYDYISLTNKLKEDGIY